MTEALASMSSPAANPSTGQEGWVRAKGEYWECDLSVFWGSAHR